MMRLHNCCLALLLAISGVLSSGEARAGAQPAASDEPTIRFDDYFLDKALRLELYVCGDANDAIVTLHDIYEEAVWPENPRHLLTPFEYGSFRANVFDDASGRLIYSKGFDTLFAEYATTDPAIKGIKRVLETTARCPFPKAKIRVEIQRRNKQQEFATVLTTAIDPADYRIRRETTNLSDWDFEIQNTGSPHDRVDVLFLAEGYTADESDKFRTDALRLTEFMFSAAPYKELKSRFNVRGIFRASAEQGTDEPRQGSFRSTALNSSFNYLDLDRYLMLEDNHAVHRMAAQVPYDTVVVLVNTKRYGGGGICLDYCTTTVDHASSPLVFLHEFGHSFAGLADEYIGSVSYNDLYPAGVEPTEPNITRELDRSRIKWKDLLTADVALPTQNPAGEVRRVQRELKTAETAAKEKIRTARENAGSDKEIQSLEAEWKLAEQEFSQKLETARRQVISSKGTVGAFEGGGYLAKGMYRSEATCWMGSVDPDDDFCVACQRGIRRMIDFYSIDVAATSAARPAD